MLTAQKLLREIFEQPSPTVKTSPRWQGLEVTGKRLDNGELELGNPIIITCHGHVEVGLCGDCLSDFERVLADVPWLLDDLDIAISGDVRFVEHGVRMGTLESDAAGPSRHPAVAAHHRLCLAIIGDGTGAHPGCTDWFDARSPLGLALNLRLYLHRLASEPRMSVLAHDISSAAKRAHHVIDMPKDLVYYGPCPDCGRDIVQERIHKDDEETLVQCRYSSCKYGQPLDAHNKRILESSTDRWLTIDELVSAITRGGEVVARKQIERWIDRNGLARELRTRASWRAGELVTNEVWTYRLGDVREMAEDEKQNGAPTSHDVASQLGVTETALRKMVERGQLTPIRANARPLRFQRDEVERFKNERSA